MKVDMIHPKRGTYAKGGGEGGYGMGRVEMGEEGKAKGRGRRSGAAMSKGEETNTHMCSRCCLP